MRSLRIFLLAAVAGGSLATAWAEDPPPAAKTADPPSADKPLAADPPPAAKQPDKAAPASPPPLLSLAPPDIHRVVPQQDLEGTIEDPDAAADEEPPPEVKVSGDQAAPEVPDNQFLALWWGLTHPTQAWRIFTPVQ